MLDVIVATAKLVERAGATEFELAWDCPHVPDADGNTPDGHELTCPDVQWNASAQFQGTRIIREGHPSPSAAALDLAERVFDGATCRCGQSVTLDDATDGCRWQLVGDSWQPSCDVEPIHVKGNRGDMAAMQQALRDRFGVS